jgi:formylglycine-generating enzyme required for sulfatase activity
MKKLFILLIVALVFTGCPKPKPSRKMISLEMKPIPAGSFQMGFPGNTHQVTLTRPFQMTRTEVTQGQWDTIMHRTPDPSIPTNWPVKNVKWNEAVKFCNNLSMSEGLEPCYIFTGSDVKCDFTKRGYRLPTEAEWEWACRAGTETDFYTGNMTVPEGPDPNLDIAGWYKSNSGGTLHKVGLPEKRANDFGLCEMHGNIAEWCWDFYGPETAGSVTDPTGPITGTEHVYRGGSYLDLPPACRSFERGIPGHGGGLGFRVVKTQ